MTRLSSNADLLKYLTQFAGLLEDAGLHKEAEEIRFASALARGTSMTEFLGESLLAMRKVRPAAHAALGEMAMRDYGRVAAQLEFSLKR